jgi:Fic family protein
MRKISLTSVLILIVSTAFSQFTTDQTIDKDAATLYLGSGGDVGPHGIVFDDGQNGSPLLELVYRSTPNQLILEHASNEADIFSIDADNEFSYFSGRLGIGINSPTESLDIVGNLALTGQILGSNLTLDLNAGTNPTRITSNKVGGISTMELQTHSSASSSLQTRILMRGGSLNDIEFYDKDQNQFVNFDARYRQAKKNDSAEINSHNLSIFCGESFICGEYDVYLSHNLRRMKIYIHEKENWTDFTWVNKKVMIKLGEARNQQGRLLGKMESLGFDLQNEAVLNTLTLDVIKSSEIEGEFLEIEQVRSSIARRLGIDIAGAVESERHVDGIVEMMLDATQRYELPLTKDRLFGWHAALFPSGWSNLYKITVADWRKDTTGPMQVVSGPMGKEKVHYQAPSSDRIEPEMKRFLDWFENEHETDMVLKAAIAHLWFVTIHPFDDGNGRITRAITDMTLARSDKSIRRFYSMSAQIRVERKQYYEKLEKTQKGNSDITEWILWFLQCLINAIDSTDETLSKILHKAEFWKIHSTTILNDRQQKIINRLLDGFDGKLTTSKWGKINKCSQDTALRDIQDLIKKDILQKEASGGRSTNYELKEMPGGNNMCTSWYTYPLVTTHLKNDSVNNIYSNNNWTELYSAFDKEYVSENRESN